MTIEQICIATNRGVPAVRVFLWLGGHHRFGSRMHTVITHHQQLSGLAFSVEKRALLSAAGDERWSRLRLDIVQRAGSQLFARLPGPFAVRFYCGEMFATQVSWKLIFFNVTRPHSPCTWCSGWLGMLREGGGFFFVLAVALNPLSPRSHSRSRWSG